MKVVAFPDIHLGFRSGSKVSHGLNIRERDVMLAFTGAVEKALCFNPDVVLVVGDLFDSHRPPSSATVTALTELGRFKCPVVVISGNHDCSLRDVWSPLVSLQLLPNLTCVYDEPKLVNVHDFTFWCVPFSSTPKFNPADFLVAHIPDKRVPQFSSSGVEVPTEKYKFCFLGHLHEPKWISDNALYIGAIERMTFNQENKPCGFVVYDSGKIDFIETPARKYVTLTSPPQDIRSLEGAIVRCLVEGGSDTSWVEDLRSSDYPLRVMVELNYSTKSSFTRHSMPFKPLLEEFDDYCAQCGVAPDVADLCRKTLQANLSE